jgi:hypothetical protein
MLSAGPRLYPYLLESDAGSKTAEAGGWGYVISLGLRGLMKTAEPS